jgi:hypothetical protein
MGSIPKFSRQIEDFCCENCGYTVSGNGFTNHCPQCIFSKHVDNNPGDRSNRCSGLMRPIGIKKKGKKISIIHHCIKCNQQKTNIISKDDNYDFVLSLPLSI